MGCPQKMLRVKDDELSMFRDTPEPPSLAGSLSDDDLPLDPELYQELCAGGAFDDHNLVTEHFAGSRWR